MKTKVLKKDIVIPAGSVFHQAPHTTERYGDDHFEHIIDLTDNTCGILVYSIDPDDQELQEYFEDLDITSNQPGGKHAA